MFNARLVFVKRSFTRFFLLGKQRITKRTSSTDCSKYVKQAALKIGISDRERTVFHIKVMSSSSYKRAHVHHSKLNFGILTSLLAILEIRQKLEERCSKRLGGIHCLRPQPKERGVGKLQSI